MKFTEIKWANFQTNQYWHCTYPLCSFPSYRDILKPGVSKRRDLRYRQLLASHIHYLKIEFVREFVLSLCIVARIDRDFWPQIPIDLDWFLLDVLRVVLKWKSVFNDVVKLKFSCDEDFLKTLNRLRLGYHIHPNLIPKSQEWSLDIDNIWIWRRVPKMRQKFLFYVRPHPKCKDAYHLPGMILSFRIPSSCSLLWAVWW